MDARLVVAAAAAEWRSLRRMARTWLLWLIVIVVGVGRYEVAAAEHAYQLCQAHAAPRFSLAGFGAGMLWLLAAGLVFLVFDTRSRDARANVADALDARAVSNAELVAGRFIAVVFAGWLPLGGAFAIIQALGGVSAAMDVMEFGEPAGTAGLATFLVFDALPALALWASVWLFLAAALRSRLHVLLVGSALFGAYLYAVFQAPLFMLPAFSGVAHLGLLGSDMVPRAIAASDVLQRGAEMALAAGFLFLAAAAWPRRDGWRRGPRVYGGTALVGVGVACMAALAAQAHDSHAERTSWSVRHRAEAPKPSPDVVRMSGDVYIHPGEELGLDLDLKVAAPEERTLDVLRFSLNLGLRVDAVVGADGPLEFRHEEGLLHVVPAAALPAGERTTVSIRAKGLPDPRFGYLDSAVDAMQESLAGAPLVQLGDQASVFDERYVVLMPATRWLPSSGANFGSREVPDFRELALDVHLPAGWVAAGPGRQWPGGRQRSERATEDIWRFSPDVPVGDFAVVAGRFERRVTTLAGVEYELLFAPPHRRRMEHLEAWERAFAAWLQGGGLAAGRAWGLDYPYETFSVVEVPASLRLYGGGPSMEVLRAMPGVQLLAEHGLPTRRFGGTDSDDVRLGQLRHGIRLGPNGVPHTAGVGRNLLGFVVGAGGDGADVVRFALDALTRRLLGSSEAPSLAAAPPLANWVASRGSLKVLDRLIGYGVWIRQPDYASIGEGAWQASEREPLVGHGAPSDQPVELVMFRSRQLADAVHAYLGHERTADLLASIRRAHFGAALDSAGFARAIARADGPLGAVVDHWLHRGSAPGFRASEVRAYRLADDRDGLPRYQIRVHVRNSGAAPGVVGLAWRSTAILSHFDDSPAPFVRSRSMIVGPDESVEMGVVTRAPPLEVRLVPHLSLNRNDMRLALPHYEHGVQLDREPFTGSRPSDWGTVQTSVVVDDLDVGFSLTGAGGCSRRPEDRPEGGGVDTDIGPYSWGQRGWRRQSDESVAAWGRYRRTLVRTPAGSGSTEACFATKLPAPGRWNLQVHLPGPSVSHGHWRPTSPLVRDALGSYDLRIAAGGEERSVSFDGTYAEMGWNDVGSFDVAGTEVRVAVSDRTSGDVVVADAVRWRPGSPVGQRP